jgi:hypothetical protein
MSHVEAIARSLCWNNEGLNTLSLCWATDLYTIIIANAIAITVRVSVCCLPLSPSLISCALAVGESLLCSQPIWTEHSHVAAKPYICILEEQVRIFAALPIILQLFMVFENHPDKLIPLNT